jgi:hypothetical protein
MIAPRIVLPDGRAAPVRRVDPNEGLAAGELPMVGVPPMGCVLRRVTLTFYRAEQVVSVLRRLVQVDAVHPEFPAYRAVSMLPPQVMMAVNPQTPVAWFVDVAYSCGDVEVLT